MKKNLNSFFKISFLMFTAYTIVATSSKKDIVPIVYTTWGVVSTCPGITANNETMTSASDGIIINPSGRSFLDYGLPISIVRIGTDTEISAVSNGINRTCIYSTLPDSGGGKTLSIYTCADNAIPTCVVTFTPL